MDSVLTCLVTDDLGPGDRSLQLIAAVADYVGVAGGIALRERRRALIIALSQLELPRGSRVVLDPLAPAFYHQAILEAGMEPFYVDAAGDHGCLNAGLIESAGAAAVICRTVLGHVPDLESIAAAGIPIIEDITEGVGANTGERRVGTYGRFAIVGMEPDGIITAGGGTVLLATSRQDRSLLRQLADALPSDSMLPDMNAALGLTQIRELELFIARRAEFASVFARAIARGRHAVPMQPGDAENVHFTFPVLLSGPASEVIQYARKKGVDAELAFAGSVLARHGESHRPATEDGGGDRPAADTAGGANGIPEAEFPVARGLLLRCVRFPLYPALSSAEAGVIERVLSTLP